MTLSGHTWSTGYNLGLLIKPMADTKIGFTYRYGITHKVSNGALTFSGLTGPLAGRNGQVAASAPLDLPDIAALGVSQKITPAFTLLGEIDYFTWSNFQQIAIHPADNSGDLVIQEKYRDTWSIAIGGEYQLTEDLKLRGGFKFDQTPTRDGYRDTRVPDGDRAWISAGAHYAFSEQIGIDAGYSHIFVKSETLSLTRPFYATAPFPIPTSETIKATSDVGLDILSVGFTYKF